MDRKALQFESAGISKPERDLLSPSNVLAPSKPRSPQPFIFQAFQALFIFEINFRTFKAFKALFTRTKTPQTSPTGITWFSKHWQDVRALCKRSGEFRLQKRVASR